MYALLRKEVKFYFDAHCMQDFKTLKQRLVEAQILMALNLELPFELMCNASDTAMGAVLGK